MAGTPAVVVYDDHLARDMANFVDGHESSPRIQLDADPEEPKAEVNLTCGPAANHAYWGKTGGDVWKPENEKFYNYTSPEHFPEEQQEHLEGGPEVSVKLLYAKNNVSLQRGDIIGYRTDDGNDPLQHYATAYGSSSVYYGDTLHNTGKFGHEAIDEYAEHVAWDKDDVYVTIWREKP